MKIRPTTVIIPVAGWGTRWLPATKAIEKAMLPVGNRPIIDWIVADCVAAGITKVIIVISEGQTQTRQYFSHNAPLNDYLTANGKAEALKLANQPQYSHVRFEFVEQPAKGKYGTAVPVALAAPLIGLDESVLVVMGDDFVYHADGSSEMAVFIDAWEHSDARHAMMATEVPRDEAHKYGIVATDATGNYKEILEKPSADMLVDFSKTVANISKYLIDGSLLRRIVAYVDAPLQQKEYYVTDPINEAVAAGETMLVHDATGTFLDGGTPESWLIANQTVAQKP